MANNITFTINFEGNAEENTGKIIKGVGTLNGVMNVLEKTMVKVGAKIVAFNQLTDSLKNLSASFGEMAAPGMALDSAMHELSAITGVVGRQLKEIEGYARSSAKTFGGSAADSVESYKLVLSQLSPEIAKVPSALSAMGRSISILSKTMGGDTAAAAEVLTTAMNQFKVSTEDPTAAAGEMARMMNVMAAAAQAGSAELPAIKAALEQSGMAAKSAAVSFEETNAAIQVLDKAGKKASEGGVALRNILATLSQGRFLPKDTVEELTAAGINVDSLADKSLSLSERLTLLKPLLNDDALLAKLFGKETYNAALALVSGTDALDEYTAAVSGTKSAEEQAAVIMESRQEQMARYKARIDDVKLAMFSAVGGLYPYIQLISDFAASISRILPFFDLLRVGLVKLIALLKSSTIALAAKSAAMRVATAVSATYKTAMSALTVALGSAKLAATALAAALTMGLSLAITAVIELVTRLSGKRSEVESATTDAADSEKIYMQSVSNTRAELEMYMARLRSFSGSREDEIALVNELNSKYSATMGSYNSVAQWYDTLTSKSETYIKMMTAEAKARLLANRVAEQSIKVDDLKVQLKDIPEMITPMPGATPVKNGFYTAMAENLEKETKSLEQDKNALADVYKEIADIRSGLLAGNSTSVGNTDTVGGAVNMETVTALEAKLAGIAKKNELLGKSNNTLSDSIAAVKSAIDHFTVSCKEDENTLMAIVNVYSKLIAKQRELRKEGIGDALPRMENAPKGEVSPMTSPQLPELDKTNGLQEYIAHLQQVQATTNAVTGATSQLFGSISAMSGALSGAAGSWLKYGSSVLQSAAQAIAAITAVVAAQKIKRAEESMGMVVSAGNSVASVPFVGPILAAAAMASMIAAILAIPKFAAGGLVSGPTMALVGEYPGASNNPEVIAPLNKLKGMLDSSNGGYGEVVFRIDGRELVGILDKENKYISRKR